MMASTIRNNAIKVLKGLAVLALCLGIWELAAVAVGNSFFLPRVGETMLALSNLVRVDGFFGIILKSLGRVLTGLVLGIVFGIILATFSHLLPASHHLISPIISVMKATPIAAIILILWFTFTDASLAIFVVFLMVTPIVWQNVYDGYRSISKEMLEVCCVFEFSYLKKLKLLIIPTVVKYLIPAVITSIGLAWKSEIAAEIMTYSNIGRSIQDYKTLFYDTPSVFAWAVVIITLSLILESITKYFLKRIKL